MPAMPVEGTAEQASVYIARLELLSKAMLGFELDELIGGT